MGESTPEQSSRKTRRGRANRPVSRTLADAFRVDPDATAPARFGFLDDACMGFMHVRVLRHGFGLIAHTYGAGSDTPDAGHQSMAERALLMQNIALAGADLLGGVGQLECATVFSPVQAVLDNEIGAMVRRFLRSPRIDAAALNWDELSSVAAGGHFLDSTHTVAACRDQLIPSIFQRQNRDDYEASNRRGAFEVARDRALAAIAAAPQVGVLDADQNREIAALTARADVHIVEVYKGAVEMI